MSNNERIEKAEKKLKQKIEKKTKGNRGRHHYV